MSHDKPNDLSTQYLIIFALLIFTAYSVWIFAHKDINQFSLALAHLSITTIGYLQQFNGNLDLLITMLYGSEFQDKELVANIRKFVMLADPEQLSFEESLELARFGAGILKLPFMLTMIVFIIWGFKNQKIKRLTRKLDFYQLLEIQKQFHPHLIPPLSMDLLNTHPDDGPGRREASPIRMAIMSNAVSCFPINEFEEINPELPPKLVTFNKSADALTHLIIDDSTKGISLIHGRCKLDEKILTDYFTKQLNASGVFDGINNMPIHLQFLAIAFVIFSQNSQEDDTMKEKAINFLQEANQRWVREKVFDKYDQLKPNWNTFIPEVKLKKLIRQHGNAKILSDIQCRHAYNLTFLIELLNRAREKGKLFPDLFRWLNYVDRTAWYALNQAGGDCAYIEGGSAWAHHLAEKSINYKIQTPFVKNATEACLYEFNREGWLYNEQ